MRMIDVAATRGAKDAANAQYIKAGLERAPPLMEQAWICTDNFVARALDYMYAQAEVPTSAIRYLMDHYDEFLPENASTNNPTVIEKYREACMHFRTHLNLQAAGNLMGYLEGKVTTHLEVSEGQLVTVRDMLKRMNDLAGERLGGQAEKTDSSKIQSSVKAFLRSKGKVPPTFELEKRNKMKILGLKPKGLDTEASETEGIMLITTTLMQLGSKNDPEIEELLTSFIEHFTMVLTSEEASAAQKERAKYMVALSKCWCQEAALVKAQEGGQSSYRQQGSRLDIVFSAFFWCLRCRVSNVQDFSTLNQVLFGLGQEPMGRQGMSRVLRDMHEEVAVRMIAQISASRDIHLPPHVLTYGRVADWICAHGGIYKADVLCDQHDGYGTSTRYVLNLKREGGQGLALITNACLLWRYSWDGAPTNDCIAEPEHLLHQFLLKKTSPFQNTHRLSGNALDVRI
ncbi:unnamed protein product, partial [Ixodes hexagonus]